MIKIDDDQLKEFLEKRGYAKTTIRSYAEYIRRVNREELTVDDVNRIYENYSCPTRCQLKTAVKLLGDFQNWMKNNKQW